MGTGLFSHTYPNGSNKLKPKNSNWKWDPADIAPDVSNFGGILSAADDTVQKALDTIDDISLGTSSFFDCTVGASGADYATLGAAILAGKKSILVIDNTTEIGDITCGSIVTIVGINRSINIDFGTYNISLVQYSLITDITFTFAYNAIKYLLTSGVSHFERCIINNNSTVDRAAITKIASKFINCTFNFPNQRYPGLGYAGADGYDGEVTGCTFNGGGAACRDVLVSTNGCIVTNCTVIGSYLLNTVINVGAGQINGLFVNTSTAIVVTSTQSDNIRDPNNRVYMDNRGGSVVNSEINNLVAYGANSKAIYTSCKFNSTLNLTDGSTIYDNISFDNCQFLSTVNLDNRNNMSFVRCSFGSGAGAVTLTMTGSCDKTIVIGCRTDVAISFNGTNTESFGNATY